MMHKGGFEAYDRTLQDLRNNNSLMDGNIVTVYLLEILDRHCSLYKKALGQLK